MLPKYVDDIINDPGIIGKDFEERFNYWSEYLCPERKGDFEDLSDKQIDSYIPRNKIIKDQEFLELSLRKRITLLEKERIMIVNNNKATFDYMDKAVKEWKNVNRINKPMYITFYSDWKNKKITKDSYSRKVTVTIDQKMKAWIDDMEVIRD